MAEAKHSESFEQIVEWAYRTLPQKIRDRAESKKALIAD
jgi:predicted Zn-dependent protease with MMP-like domain